MILMIIDIIELCRSEEIIASEFGSCPAWNYDLDEFAGALISADK